MLTLFRNSGEGIKIGEDIMITVRGMGNCQKVTVMAPKELGIVRISREEVNSIIVKKNDKKHKDLDR